MEKEEARIIYRSPTVTGEASGTKELPCATGADQ